MATCLVGLGSNVGDRQQSIERATDLLVAVGRLLAASTMHSTRPIGGPADQAQFLNAAVLLETDRSPVEVLAALQQMEQQLGRLRAERWGPRTIDLDLLLYDQAVLDLPNLVVPHPRFAFRRFVLAPAAEIAGSMQHPTTGFTVQELMARLGRRPIHVSVLGDHAVTSATIAAQQVHGSLLGRPVRRLDRSPSLAEISTFLRHVEENWNNVMQETNEPVISDFWVGEIWIKDVYWWPVTDQLGLEAIWDSLPYALVAPHLVVSLQSGPDGSTPGQELLELLNRPRQFPVLVLKEHSPESVVAEITAAVQAMSD